MREIFLTRGKVALVDDEDYERVSALKWQTWVDSRGRRTEYAVHCVTGGGQVAMHRFVLGLADGDPEVDHRNWDGLDNRRGNLRVVSRSQQMANRRKYSGQYSSRYKGVDYLQSVRRYRARLQVDGAFRYLGRHTSEADAACAYNQAAREAFGPYAVLNAVRLEAPT